MKVTAIAPAITKARLPTQVPPRMAAKSRKLSTFAGFDMPDTISPRPKTSPMMNCSSTAMILPPMPDEEDRDDGSGHEGGRRDQRAHREPRQPADTVAGGAAIAPHRTEAHQKPGEHQHRHARLDALCRETPRSEPHQHGCCDETGDEGEPSGKLPVL